MDAGKTSPTVVPRRSDLLDQMRRANRYALGLLVLEFALLAVVTAFIDWEWVQNEPILTTVAIGVMVCPFIFSILKFGLTKKTRIQNLKETTKFGQYDKYRLQALFRATLDRLQLPDDGLSVYIVASRSINAAAMHVGFGNLFKSFNGIYLNRQTLHKLEPAEIQDLMGHELGHYYKYYLVVDRFRIVTMALGSLVGILAAQQIGFDGLFGYLFLAGIPAIFWMMSSLPYARNARAIEFLCDDFGAQVGGVLTSIHGLLKLGLDAEVESVVLQQAIMSKIAGNMSPSELVETITASIPYGHASREEIQERVNRELRQRAAAQSMSLAGLLRHMWNSDLDADAVEQLELQAKRIKKLQSEPRLDWEALLRNPNRIELDETGMQKLIALIESCPDQHLFRVQETADDTHPPLRSRILYLWYNRSEIENRYSAGNPRSS